MSGNTSGGASAPGDNTPSDAAPSGGASDDLDPFGGLNEDAIDDLSSDDEGSAPDRIPSPVPSPAAAAAPAPAAQPAAAAPAAPAPAAAAPAPASPQTAEPAPSTEPEALNDLDPQVLLGVLQNQGEAYVENIAQTIFPMTPEQVVQMTDDPAGFYSRGAARILVESIKATLGHINRLVPAMFEAHQTRSTERATRVSEAETAFKKAWPGVPDNDEANGLIRQFAASFRQAEPKITRDELIQKVGRAVSGYLGLPAAPAASATRRGAPAAAVRQFTPAPAGVEIRQPAPEVGPFDGLAGEYDE